VIKEGITFQNLFNSGVVQRFALGSRRAPDSGSNSMAGSGPAATVDIGIAHMV
jgi:hypothetical protein